MSVPLHFFGIMNAVVFAGKKMLVNCELDFNCGKEFSQKKLWHGEEYRCFLPTLRSLITMTNSAESCLYLLAI